RHLDTFYLGDFNEVSQADALLAILSAIFYINTPKPNLIGTFFNGLCHHPRKRRRHEACAVLVNPRHGVHGNDLWSQVRLWIKHPDLALIRPRPHQTAPLICPTSLFSIKPVQLKPARCSCHIFAALTDTPNLPAFIFERCMHSAGCSTNQGNT